MAYDPDLADRVRQALSGRADSREVKMFGGLSFVIKGRWQPRPMSTAS
jgi:hypothetical protein